MPTPLRLAGQGKSSGTCSARAYLGRDTSHGRGRPVAHTAFPQPPGPTLTTPAHPLPVTCTLTHSPTCSPHTRCTLAAHSSPGAP